MSEEFGPYVVYECLGQGGMATVHRAEKRGVGIRRPVALKRLLPHVAATPELVKLFVDEARLASHLHHTNVAQTYELGRVGETFFIAMEYAAGPTLTQIVRQSQHAGSIPLTITVNILTQVCEALDYAHNLCDETGRPLRIIHRDVSPANIIVTDAGIVKLIDFGIAKATISSVKTQTGHIKGKFGYIAPEYITGRIDARVDLFAVGVLAHEMLAGRRLFEGKDDFETMANIRDMVIEPPSHWNSEVTPDLDDIVMTALERDPAQRWQTAGALQVALTNAARDLGAVIGNQQLVDWVDWAFRQEADGELRDDTGDTDALAEPYASRAPRRRSSVSMEIGLSSADLLDLSTPPPELAGPPSETARTVPLDRVLATLGDFETLTPPAMTPTPVVRTLPTALAAWPADIAPRTPAARPSRPFREPQASSGEIDTSEAVDALEAADSIDTNEAIDALDPTSTPDAPEAPDAPDASDASDASDAFDSSEASDAFTDEVDEPMVIPAIARREREVIVVPPGAMFAGSVFAAASDPARRHRTILWLTLLMLGLGLVAMAAATFWPS